MSAKRVLLWGVIALSIAHLALLAGTFAVRAAFRYELEWMEGGMLGHALRLSRGEPIYAPPSGDFISFLYTPLYPAVVAGLGKVFGLSFLLGRLVSIASFAVAVACAAAVVARGGSRVFALAAAAAVASTFPDGGAWYDIVRNDSLYLGLAWLGLALVVTRGDRLGWAALAGALLGLSFFAKQTGSVVAAAGGAALILLRLRDGWAGARAVAAYGLVSCAVFATGVLWLDATSDGWFWRYAFELHQQHEFYPRRAWLETPLVLLRAQPALFAGLAVALALLARRRGLDRELGALALVALAGVALACLGFGTQFAHVNAYIPGLLFPAVAWAAALGRLAAAGLAVPAAVLALAHLGTTFWDPRPHLPAAGDEAAGDRLIARLRAARGDVLVPFHPFYAVMAGKPPHLHRMGVLDIGMPADLAEKLRSRHYDLVVMDDKTQWPRWQVLRQTYRDAAVLTPGVDAPRVVTGAPTVPRWVLEPRLPEP